MALPLYDKVSALHIITTGNSTPSQASSKRLACLQNTILPFPSEKGDLIVLRDLFKEGLVYQTKK